MKNIHSGLFELDVLERDFSKFQSDISKPGRLKHVFFYECLFFVRLGKLTL